MTAALADIGIHLRVDRPGEHRAPCPQCDRGSRDTALSVRVDPDGHATWICHRCDWRGAVRGDHVTGSHPEPPRPTTPPAEPLAWSERAESIWSRSVSIRGTDAERYLLERRCRLLPADGDLRYLPSRGEHGPTMIARITDAVTGAPLSLHFTRLDGREPRKLLLSGHRKTGGVVRLWPDDAVSTGLLVAEGIETALSAAHAHTPVWAAVDAGKLAALPVLGGIECLVIGVDHDIAGLHATQVCAARWAQAGAEVVLWTPETWRDDINDVAARVA